MEKEKTCYSDLIKKISEKKSIYEVIQFNEKHGFTYYRLTERCESIEEAKRRIKELTKETGKKYVIE